MSPLLKRPATAYAAEAWTVQRAEALIPVKSKTEFP